MMFLALYSLLNDPWHVTSFTICCTWRNWHIQPSHHSMRAWDKHVSYCILSSLLMSLIFLMRGLRGSMFQKGNCCRWPYWWFYWWTILGLRLVVNIGHKILCTNLLITFKVQAIWIIEDMRNCLSTPLLYYIVNSHICW